MTKIWRGILAEGSTCVYIQTTRSMDYKEHHNRVIVAPEEADLRSGNYDKDKRNDKQRNLRWNVNIFSLKLPFTSPKKTWKKVNIDIEEILLAEQVHRDKITTDERRNMVQFKGEILLVMRRRDLDQRNKRISYLNAV